MQKRLPRFALLALSIAATDAFAQTTAASPSTDYGNPQAWLCRPDRPGACDVDLSTTVLGRDGRSTVERARLDPKAPVDCFYVYPTVSTDTTTNSDLVPDAAERNVVRLQLARFGTQCRLFAPMYRQLTLAAMSRAHAAGNESPDFLGVGYKDVRAAWRYYLAHDNGGRGVVLIGHSQGTSILTELIRHEIEGTPIQSRIVSALLIGAPGGILVPRGRDVGGTFAHMPLCRAATETGCVVAYSSFRVTAPPTATTRFGRSADSTLVAACTNPAALGGGEAALKGYFDAAGGTALPLGPSDPWTVGGRPVATPMVRVVGLLKAQCRSNAFASYLEVSVERGPGSPASRDIQGDLVEPLGLHLVDMEVAMGNLIDLVGQQTRSYLASNHGH
jgi:pimeloyl-ACP methyl ester carboxylesterase